MHVRNLVFHMVLCITLNKSSVLICRNKAMAHAAPPVFTVDGGIIWESDKVKYHGHIICNDMSDDDDNYYEAKTTI